MQSLHYIIYKTTNLINGKIYIGKHVTANLNDGYLGSGKLLRRAIDKYGVENFHKEILHIFDNEVDMNACEAELVTEVFVLQETNYNLCVGGQGGFSYINRECWDSSSRKEHNSKISGFKTLTNEQRSEYSKKGNASRLRKIRSGELIPHPGWNKGQELSAEHKQKIGLANKISSKGCRNSQYGRRFKWMTDGHTNKKVSHNDVEMYVTNGWIFGKVHKKK